MDDELDGTSLEFVGVFHWQERISFFQSPCLYYPRGDSDPLLGEKTVVVVQASYGRFQLYDSRVSYRHS